jgi:Protein of unknown function (DUF1592)/Protein of unknown function (DUF1588)/Protein of unknown function (DUF1595)/Protein of unknown function (DUF1587)
VPLASLVAAVFIGCAASGHADQPGGADSGSQAVGVDGGTAPSYLPVRIRRLTDAEWGASVKALLGLDSKTAAQFTPDTRQATPPPLTFTVNDAQQVDPVLAAQIDAAAHEIATAAALQLSSVAPCGDPTNGGDTCASSFIATFAPAAYRRPATQSEVDGLLGIYRVAATGGTYSDGIQAVIAAVLESPGFLYITEMGSASPVSGGAVTLTEPEIASELSYLLTGSPPDSSLLATAQAGQLSDGPTRQQQARRLVKTAAAKAQLTQVVEQWLGIDGIADTAKDSNAYQDYASVKGLMKAEADAFIAEIVWNEAKGVADLFGATWTMADPTLAHFYGAGASDSTTGRVSLAGTGRTGILDQGAFLSTYASATASAPILRGVAVLRRVACVDVPEPSTLNIVVAPPPPDPTKTTRQLYALHASNSLCAGCHASIDSIGFTFENFDGEGKARTMDANPPQPVDSATTVASSLVDLGGDYADSAHLAATIASSNAVRQCFARYMFRYAAARNGANAAMDPADAAERAAEESFVATWNALPADAQGSLIEVLVAYAGSTPFVTRQVVP